jgi:signal transduction histidine kinase
LSFSILKLIEKRTINNNLEQKTLIYTKAYNTIYDQYKELSSVVFTGLSTLTNIESKLEKLPYMSKKQQDKLRKEIYEKIIGRYDSLKKRKIKNINFILANDEIFLKVKKKNKRNIKISNKRKVIKYTRENLKPVDSFEIGKNGAGFRYVYPYIKDGKFLGSMEITFGAEAITAGIMKQYSVLSNFFIKRDSFSYEFLSSNQKKFKTSHHKNYMYDMRVLKELKKITNKDMKQLKPNREILTNTYQMAQGKKSDSFYGKDIESIFTIIPIKHAITKEYEAFLTIRSSAKELTTLSRNYTIILVLSIFLIASILFTTYLQIIRNEQEKRRLQKAMEKDKQLLEQAKMAQMGEMLGNIAHQWRQPLSTITTAASGVKINHEYDILKHEEIPEFMETILKNADYLSKTIDNFRDFIKEKHELKELVIQEKIEKTLEIVSATLSSNYIKVINTVHYEEPIRINLIQGVLSQVLMNLLNNAKDAMVDNNVEERWVKIEAQNLEDKVIITLEDSGGGIPDDIMPRIFDPYFTTKHQSQGTGLGLYMSKEIMKKHLKGDIWVRNTENGAKFFLLVPKNLTKEDESELY